jgi:hydroxymethylbilane synthase
MSSQLIIGTRGSALALVQTHWVRDELRKTYPHLDVHVQIIQTKGDASQSTNTPLSAFADKGIFAKELETALLSGEIDLAVHSMKDLSSVLPEGLCICAVPLREDPRDAIVGKRLSDLLPGEKVGTGSVRRKLLLGHLRPDLQILDIRGNVDTRIRKLREGQFDSIVLAVAGLNRLGRADEIAEILDPRSFVPDPGQGALALQTRTGDVVTKGVVGCLNDTDSWAATAAERAFLAAFGGGCQTPVGAWATVTGDRLDLIAMAASDGVKIQKLMFTGSIEHAILLGQQAAAALIG